jgi:hypothetical protein
MISTTMNALMKLSQILLFVLLCEATASSATNFVKLNLPTGIALDLPRNWWLIQGELNKTVEISAQAAVELTGVDLSNRKDVNLIAANCQPKSMYAAVRLNVRRPPLFSPEQILKSTPADLAEMGAEMKKSLIEILPKQGFDLKDYISTTREEIAGFPAITCHYRRTDDAEGRQTALVWVIQIFAPGRTYRLILGYRESEAGIWKPVLERVKTSIEIQKRLPDEK